MAIVLLAAPVVLVLLGGVYSVPALAITREREPYLGMLLGAGLATTVFGCGWLLCTPLGYSVGTWIFAVGLLHLARRSYGSLGHSLERFGLVHGTALVAATLAAAQRMLAGPC